MRQSKPVSTLDFRFYTVCLFWQELWANWKSWFHLGKNCVFMCVCGCERQRDLRMCLFLFDWSPSNLPLKGQNIFQSLVVSFLSSHPIKYRYCVRSWEKSQQDLCCQWLPMWRRVMTLKHFQSYRNRKSSYSPFMPLASQRPGLCTHTHSRKTHTQTHKRRGSHGIDKVRRGRDGVTG